MFNWLFKKVVKIREKVSKDLGQEDVEKPFLEHLEDLRTMLVRMAITLAVVVLGTFVFYHYLWDVVRFPLVLAHLEEKIIFTELKPIGGFMAIMNLSIVAGIVIACPLLLYFILQFVLPGLRTTEKKVLFPALAVGGGLFLLGALFAYFFVVPKALGFFYSFNTGLSAKPASAGQPLLLEVDLSRFTRFDFLHILNPVVTVQATPVTPPAAPFLWGISDYVRFICQFVLIFGLCFELPVVVMALVKLDILSYKVMKGTRSYAAVAIAVISTIVAPSPDVFTLALIAVPLYTLYEICIWLAWWLNKRDRELYPEHYKSLEEDEKAMAADDWDNENYNPWSDDDEEADELRRPARPAPAGTQPMTPPAPEQTHAGEGGGPPPPADVESHSSEWDEPAPTPAPESPTPPPEEARSAQKPSADPAAPH